MLAFHFEFLLILIALLIYVARKRSIRLFVRHLQKLSNIISDEKKTFIASHNSGD